MPHPEPNQFEKFNWLIHLQHVRGEAAACKDLIKNEIKRSGGLNEFAYFKQGFIFREEGKVQESLDAFQICVKLNPSDAENLKEVGRCLYEMRRFRLALEAYVGAERISNRPDWQIHYNAGQCLMRLGNAEKARNYAQKAVQLGKHEAAYTLLIKILTNEGDLKSAAAVSSAAVESCPDSVSLLTESGLLYLKMGQTQLAFERLSSALALDPACSKALLGIGCISQSYDEHDTALTKYKVAILNEADSVALWNNIGICFYAKQKYVAAISCLKRALWLSPMNWRVLFNLGLVHLSTSQAASAFNFLCAAVNLRPDAAYCFAVLGYTLLELKDSENGCRAYKQALLLNPDDPFIVTGALACFIVSARQDDVRNLAQKLQNILEQNDDTLPKEIGEFAQHLSTLALNPQHLQTEVGNNVEIDSSCETSKMKERETHLQRELTPDEV